MTIVLLVGPMLTNMTSSICSTHLWNTKRMTHWLTVRKRTSKPLMRTDKMILEKSRVQSGKIKSKSFSITTLSYPS